MNHAHHAEGNGGGGRRWKWILVGFLAVAGIFLWTEHKAHLLGVWPYLLVLACPLMHLFHRHGEHRPEASQGQQKPEGPS